MKGLKLDPRSSRAPPGPRTESQGVPTSSESRPGRRPFRSFLACSARGRPPLDFGHLPRYPDRN
eukprot:6176816-Alexandrium_andersonii.AAC.1